MNERYVLCECIGEGAQGVVHRALDRTLERSVVMRIVDLEGDEARARFQREIRILRDISHPNVARLLDGWMDGSRGYLVHPDDGGRSLEDRLAAEGPLPWTEVLRVLRDVASALEVIHERGILHRDVKPSNLLQIQRPDATIGTCTVLIDFGIGRRQGEPTLTAMDSLMGSMLYTAPERHRGNDREPRSDLYSLGVSAYELLTGVNPFQADGLVATRDRHLHHRITALPSLDPEPPRPMCNLVLDLMRKNPAERPDSARVVKQRADAILAARLLGS